MSKESETTSHKFMNYLVIPQQRLIYNGRKKLKISKKGFDILLALIQSHGHVIPKDDLIALVWPNQIVTDAALNKQVTRLRQAIDPDATGGLIETVRGVGFRFIPEITETDQATPDGSTTAVNDSSHNALVLTIVLVVLALFVSLFWPKNKPVPPLNETTVKTINLALMPGSNSQGWLNVGGINYLAEQLRLHPEVQAIKPESNWFNRADADKLAIDINRDENVSFVLIIKNQHLKNRYISDLTLKDTDGVLAKTTLETNNLKTMLKNTETWTVKQLQVLTDISAGNPYKAYETTDFVLENHIRGLAAADNKELTQAIKFFQTAIDHDANFYPAWFGLIETESDSGQFEHALALINTLQKSTTIDPNTIEQLKPIKAHVLVYLNRLPEAQKLLDSSLPFARNSQNVGLLIKSLQAQVMLYDYQGGLDQSDIPLFEELLQITQKYQPSPNKIATIQHNLAVNYLSVGDTEQAIDTIHKAIQKFKITDNAEGLVSSYRVWADNLYIQAKYGEALLVLKKAEPLLPRVEGARTLAHYYMALAENLTASGYRKKALSTLHFLHQMGIKYGSLEAEIKALIGEIENAITFNDPQEARRIVDEALRLIEGNATEFPVDYNYLVGLDMYISARFDAPQKSQQKVDNYLKDEPELSTVLEHELVRIKAHILNQQGYHQQAVKQLENLEKTYVEQHDFNTANAIAFELMAIQLIHEPVAFTNSLNRLKPRVHFSYPISLFKAQNWARQHKFIQASAEMQTLKKQANEFWTADLQLLLDEYQLQVANPN